MNRPTSTENNRQRSFQLLKINIWLNMKFNANFYKTSFTS
jgi:hypothetical protein